MAIIESDQEMGVNAEETIREHPRKSRGYLAMINESERAMDLYQAKCDGIDRLYADLERLSILARDREYQLFWSNIQVILPSIYARQPVPVCVPKFHDNRPDLRTASEFLERAVVTAFDLTYINEVMLLVRDDLAINGRGTAWVRQDDYEGSDRICIDHVNRRDFLHDPARNWMEVDWVARRCWLTKQQMKDRFDYDGPADYQVNREARDVGGADNEARAIVFEMWVKSEGRVVWVSEGIEDVLDEQSPPHLDLECFFPCPKPAYGTLMRGGLVPVPDLMFYKDQLEEINQITAKIHALTDAIQVRGFYQAGGDIGAAVEAAMSDTDNRKVMIPVANMAAIGPNNAPFVMLPMVEVAQTISGLIEERRQIIDDVYQIIGLSDIVRGATEPDESLGAQQIKRESTSTRVRDKVNELVRFARDLVRIAAEIMSENFDKDTLSDMAQMELPTKKDVEKDVKELEKGAKEAFDELGEEMQKPEMAQQIQQNPQLIQEAQQNIIKQFQPRLDELANTVTIDAVMDILRDQKTRPFAFDIETDSTIFPDEQVEKRSRMEFMQVLSESVSRFAPLLEMSPAFAPMFAEMVKFAMAPYRVGRQLEGTINEAIDQAQQMAGQNKEEGEGAAVAEAQKMLAEAEMEKAKAQQAKVQVDAAIAQADMQRKMNEMQQKAASDQFKAQVEAQKLQTQLQDTQGKLAETEAKINLMQAQTAEILSSIGLDVRKQDLEEYKTANEVQSREVDQALAIRGDQRQDRGEARADRQQGFSEQQGQRQQTLAERQAMTERTDG